MSTPVVIFTVIGVIVVLVGSTAWALDARRNKHVVEYEKSLRQPRRGS